MTAGTQWSEYYWKDQTVMLLMLEPDFPDGKNPDFCAKLFREEPGVWKLKMEQFKRLVRTLKERLMYNYSTTQMVGEREKRPLTRILRHGEELRSLWSFPL